MAGGVNGGDGVAVVIGLSSSLKAGPTGPRKSRYNVQVSSLE